jgi:uncharacterized protein (TIGR01777 family)
VIIEMDVFITGGTGVVGRAVIDLLADHGHGVTVLSRRATGLEGLPSTVPLEVGDPRQAGSWQRTLAQHDGVINLAGASIFRRWSAKGKRLITESRMLTTRNVVHASTGGQAKVKVLLSVSGIGYYGHCGNEILLESSPQGTGFLAELAAGWEAAANRATDSGLRVVNCRLAHVLARKGGMLAKLVPVFQWGMGSPWGRGTQWFSWIHEQDLARVLVFLMETDHLRGPVNCAAPHPVTNAQMVMILRDVLHRPRLLPHVPGPLLRLALGEFADVFLEGQRVSPSRLLEAGFTFEFPNLREAFEDLRGGGGKTRCPTPE